MAVTTAPFSVMPPLSFLEICHSEIEQIVLFSTLARGAGRSDSDIDVAVEADRRLTPEQRIAIIEALAMEFGRPVELVNLKIAGQPLLTQVVNTSKRY